MVLIMSLSKPKASLSHQEIMAISNNGLLCSYSLQYLGAHVVTQKGFHIGGL